MRITTLVENTSVPGLPVEHGLSLYIETEHHTILFDSGQGTLFAENAERLGKDLTKVDLMVLSHGHYDHGGGLRTFLERNDHAPVYMSRYAFESHWNGTEKYIGLDETLVPNDRFVYTDGTLVLDEELTLCSPVGRERVADLDTGGLLRKENGTFLPEDFRHEHYLLITEGEKRVLISGCSHQGILNIVDWFRPDVLVGGFHYMKKPLDEKLIENAVKLDAYDTTYYTCHCTGADQFRFMRPHMTRAHYLSCGETIEV